MGRETLEFLDSEKLHNPDFEPVESDGFRNQGTTCFTMSPTKWIEGVNAIGLISKSRQIQNICSS